MKNLDNSHSDTPHATNSDETDGIYEQFLKSMENLELETDNDSDSKSDKQEEVTKAVVAPPSSLSIDSLDSFDSDSVDNVSMDNNAPLFAEIDLEEVSAIAPASSITADDFEDIDNRHASIDIDNVDSLHTDDMTTDTPINPAIDTDIAADIAADNVQDSVADDAAALVETAAQPKSLLGRFKKPKPSKALRDKPARTKAPKKTKASKKDTKAPKETPITKTKKTAKAPINRTMLIILGGLVVTLALAFVLISTDMLSPFTDELTGDDTPATTSSEVSNPEISTAETTDASAAPDTPTPDVVNQTASNETSTIADSGVDDVEDSANTDNSSAAETTPTSAEGIQEAQNSVVSYEEFTEAADTTLYRDAKD